MNYFDREALSEPCLRNLFLAPIMGLLFVVALPFIGYYLVVAAIFDKLGRTMQDVFSHQVVVGESHLTGHLEGGSISTLDELDKEIQERRLDKPLNKE